MARDYLPTLKTRASLLERLRDWQDQASWDDFFDTYWRLIYSTARKAGLSDDEAQDAVQETLFSVARNIRTFKYDPSRSFKGWLRTVTGSRIIDQMRKRGPVQASGGPSSNGGSATDVVQNIPDPASLVPDQSWEIDWQKNLYAAALARIRARVEPQTYQLFDFYVNKDWPPKKVAERFGVSISQVYLARHRLTAMLKQEIQRLEEETI